MGPSTNDNSDPSNWCIKDNPDGIPRKVIVNIMHPIELSNEAYNYEIYTPIVLATLSKTSTFVLSAYYTDDKLGLKLHDLRLINDEIVSSVAITFRGTHYQLSRFKNEMSRVADSNRCVGIGFFFRKMCYAGFNTFLAPRRFVKKVDSPLRDAMDMVKTAMKDE